MFSGVFLITGNKQQQELKQNHQASSMTVSPSTLESDGVDECLAVVDEHSPLLLSSPTPLDGHQHHLHVTFAGPPAVYNSSSSRSSSSSSNSAAYFAEKSFASSHPSSAYASTTSSTPAAVAAATTTSNSSPHRVKTTASSSYSPSRIFFPRHRRVSSGLNGINNTTLKRFQPDLSPGTGTGLFLYRHRSNTTDGDEYHSSSDGNVADGCNTAGAFPRERVESVDQPPPPFVMEVGSSSPNTPSAHLFRQQQLQEQQQQQQQFQQPKTSRNSRILHWFSIGSKGSAGGRRKPSTTTTSSSSSSTTTTTTAARSISASTGLLQVLDSPFSSPVRGGGCGSSATIISTQTPGVASVLAFSSSAREAVKRELEAAEHSFKCSAGSVSGGSSSRK